jgi:hypothetical protein
MNPTIAAALIAGGISVASFAFNSWTTARTLHAARAASLRDRQAAVYQQVLAFMSHNTEVRRNVTRTIRYDDATEARRSDLLASYTPPNWFELQSSVLAFCPDSVVHAFIAAKEADDEVSSARAAHAQAIDLNQAYPPGSDPNGAAALQAQYLQRLKDAERADSELIEMVRDKMLGTRPPEGIRHSLIGMFSYEAQKRRSLR